MKLFLSTTLLAIALSSAGCGGDEGARTDQGVDHLSFEEALTHSSDTPVTVTGALLIEGERARLCDVLAESYPPRCGPRHLEVVSLPPEMPKMEESPDGRVRWLGQVTVMGVVSGREIAIGEVLD